MLLKTLKENGYFVYWGGKNDLVSSQVSLNAYCDIFHKPARAVQPDFHFSQGWRAAKGTAEFYDMLVGRTAPAPGDSVFYDSDWSCVYKAIEIVETLPEDQPFCLYLPLIYPHPPYGVEDPWYSSIDRAALNARRVLTGPELEGKSMMFREIYRRAGLYDLPEERFREIRSVYLGMCARVDHQFGLLMQALKDRGFYQNTAVFFLSDHGDYTGDYCLVEKAQNCFEDPIVRVPFIIKPPASTGARPGISDCLVELTDLVATVEELAGIRPRYSQFGKSLVPLITGEAESHRDAVFCEGGRLPGELHCAELNSLELPRDVFSLYEPKVSVQFNEPAAHGKALMVRTPEFKYVFRLEEPDELYNMNDDPWECRNLIGESQLREVVHTLRERALRFMVETADVVPWRADRRL